MNNRKIIKLLGDNKSDAPYQGRFGLIPGAALSGGSWEPALPLANLQDPELGLIARSTSADPAHARFSIWFSRVQTLKAFFLGHTNLTIYAQVRLVGWLDAEGTIPATGFDLTFDAYPPVAFTRDLPWTADNWWSGKPDRSTLERLTQNAFTVFDRDKRARRIDVEIIDPMNPAGCIDLGRLICPDGWMPSRNPIMGGMLGLEDDTTLEKSMSGAEFADVREPCRVYTVNYANMPEQEVLSKGWELQRLAGTHGEILVVDDSSPINLHRLSFLARFRRLTGWERTSIGRAGIAFELKERLP